MRFKQWLEWGSPNEIRGEYWIQDGFVDFADGDVGDKNHEGIAMDHIVGRYADEVQDLADELELDDFEVSPYGEVDHEEFERALSTIREKLEMDINMSEQEADVHIMQALGCDQDTYTALLGYGDPRLYVMEKEGWIAVRSNNVELFGYSASRQKEIANAIRNILYEEQGYEYEKKTDPEQVELSIYDFKTGKGWYTTLQELEQPQVSAQMSVPLRTTYNKQWVTKRDSEENKYANPQPSQPNPWNVAAQKAGIGSELWRGTSEATF